MSRCQNARVEFKQGSESAAFPIPRGASSTFIISVGKNFLLLFRHPWKFEAFG